MKIDEQFRSISLIDYNWKCSFYCTQNFEFYHLRCQNHWNLWLVFVRRKKDVQQEAKFNVDLFLPKYTKIFLLLKRFSSTTMKVAMIWQRFRSNWHQWKLNPGARVWRCKLSCKLLFITLQHHSAVTKSLVQIKFHHLQAMVLIMLSI